jgi:predicted alpha/beta-hydrolase family hydrolase
VDGLLIDGPKRAPRTLILAHGAGASMDSPFMDRVAAGVAAAGVRVVRFEFPYMRARRESGGRRPPDRMPALLDAWNETIDALGPASGLVIGGKSMGGRVASLVADERGVAGLVCLGYPFHPPGKPDRLRTEHLAGLRTPTLILQGTRDPFGSPAEIAGYSLSRTIEVRFLEDGDHSFKPRVRSGRTEKQNLGEAIERIAAFVRGLPVG